MAAGIKYLGSFINRYNKNVSVILISDGATITAGLSFGKDPVTIAYDGEDEDIYQTMIPSKASINIMIGEDDADLFEDINNMTENTFGVLITIRESFFPFNLLYKWEGWLVPDEQVRKFTYQDQPMTLTAIDPISRSKGQKLLNTDGSYIYGKQTLKFIVDRCLQGVFTPDTSLATYNLVVDSDLTLSNTTSTTLPPLLEQLQVNAEAFNDDVGKPKSGFDVLQMIAKSLFMRVFYENGNVYFIDILQYTLIGASPSISLNTFFYKNEFTTEGTNTLLLGNSENITRTRTFRDSIAKFKYASAVGLLIDGNLVNWTPIGGGYKLTNWYYSPYFNSKGDRYLRRQGTGRAENPYGILLKYLSTNTSPGQYQFRHFDIIAGKTGSKINQLQELNLKITLRLSNAVAAIPNLQIWIYAFNDNNPAVSWYYQANGWTSVDLTGTDFDLLGQPDWLVANAAYDAALNPGFPTAGGSGMGGSGGSVGNNLLISLEQTTQTQEASLDIGSTPMGFKGDIYVFVQHVVYLAIPGTSADANNSLLDTTINSILLTSKVSKINDGNFSGEIQYVSRDIVTSKDNTTRELDFNTTANVNTAGALSNAVSFTETSGTIAAGTNLTKIALIGAPEPLYSGVSLMEYNAIMMMWLNYAQYKIDVETIGNRNLFADGISMSQFYDSGKPSTEIYNSVFLQTKSTWKLKEGRRSVTIISTKDAKRDITHPPSGVLDDTHDFSEFYYMK